MEEVKRLFGEKANVMNEFDIDTEKLTIEIKNGKSWTSPGIDEVQILWWKKLVAAQKSLLNTFQRIIFDNSMILWWWLADKTVLLAKTKDLMKRTTEQ